MSRRKLLALGYDSSSTFHVNDETERRKLVVWLEDQAIRHYKVDQRAQLRDIGGGQWVDACQMYLTDLGCPYPWTDCDSVIDWLLTFALRLEYEDNQEVYAKRAAKVSSLGKESAPQVVRANVLDNLDFQSDEFKTGVEQLANYLKVPLHPNHLITLRAINKLIHSKYSKDEQERRTEELKTIKMVRNAPMTLDTINLGFTTGDAILDKAVKVLRLLYINDLRDLQTAINGVLVSAQSLTADPKTDTGLGQVGRK
jgi:RLL motif-containing protein 1